MRLEQALKKMEEHQKAMQLAATTSEIVSGRYQAHMTLFNMAVLVGDKEESERIRSVLHDFLDQILDAGYDIHTRQREMKLLVQQVQGE